jgi:hypothetical protein
MSGATTTTTLEAVKEMVDGLIETADYLGSPMRDMIPAITSTSDSSYRWNVRYGNNTSTAYYAEGDAVGAAGNTLTSKAAVAYDPGYLRTVVSVTGHAIDNAKDGYWKLLEDEIKSGMADHVHGREGLCISNVEAAIDDDATYAGLTRATVKMASYAPAAIGTLALSDLGTLWTTLQTDPLIAPVNSMRFLSAIGVQNAYTAVASGVQYNEFNQTRGLIMDAGKLTAGLAYNGRPFDLVPTMTDGTLLFVDPKANLLRVIHRPITVVEMAKVDDSIRMVVESCEITVCLNPKFAAKLIEI